nr:DUF2202 domain-containing protein [Candidatus Gracilibacteria bacterium]
MNKSNKIYIAIAISLISLMSIASANAMNGNGQGLGYGSGNGSGQQINQQNHTPGDLISTIATGSLSEQEKLDLYYQYNEEKVARDLYTYFYSLYGAQIFQNIAEAEQQHMDSVKVLLDRYNLEIPSNYGELETTYNTLKIEGEIGLKEAYEVGIKVKYLMLLILLIQLNQLIMMI